MDGIATNGYGIVVTHARKPELVIYNYKNGTHLSIARFDGEVEADYFRMVLDKMFRNIIINK